MTQRDQWASRQIRDGGTVITWCEQCHARYAERTPPGKPPCDSCRVQLVSDNEDAAKVLMMVRHQTTEERVKDGIIIDLSIPALEIAMGWHGVENRLGCAERVRRAWYALRGRGDES